MEEFQFPNVEERRERENYHHDTTGLLDAGTIHLKFSNRWVCVKAKPLQTAELSSQGFVLIVLRQAFPFFLCHVCAELKITGPDHIRSYRSNILLY